METKTVLVGLRTWMVIEIDSYSGIGNLEFTKEKYAEYLLLQEQFKKAQIELRQIVVSRYPEYTDHFRF